MSPPPRDKNPTKHMSVSVTIINLGFAIAGDVTYPHLYGFDNHWVGKRISSLTFSGVYV